MEQRKRTVRPGAWKRGVSAMKTATTVVLSYSDQIRSQNPARFICPILGEVLADPVSTEYGDVFERAAILAWIRLRPPGTDPTCPLSGRPLTLRWSAEEMLHADATSTRDLHTYLSHVTGMMPQQTGPKTSLGIAAKVRRDLGHALCALRCGLRADADAKGAVDSVVPRPMRTAHRLTTKSSKARAPGGGTAAAEGERGGGGSGGGGGGGDDDASEEDIRTAAARELARAVPNHLLPFAEQVSELHQIAPHAISLSPIGAAGGVARMPIQPLARRWTTAELAALHTHSELLFARFSDPRSGLDDEERKALARKGASKAQKVDLLAGMKGRQGGAGGAGSSSKNAKAIAVEKRQREDLGAGDGAAVSADCPGGKSDYAQLMSLLWPDLSQTDRIALRAAEAEAAARADEDELDLEYGEELPAGHRTVASRSAGLRVALLLLTRRRRARGGGFAVLLSALSAPEVGHRDLADVLYAEWEQREALSRACADMGGACLGFGARGLPGAREAGSAWTVGGDGAKAAAAAQRELTPGARLLQEAARHATGCLWKRGLGGGPDGEGKLGWEGGYDSGDMAWTVDLAGAVARRPSRFREEREAREVKEAAERAAVEAAQAAEQAQKAREVLAIAATARAASVAKPKPKHRHHPNGPASSHGDGGDGGGSAADGELEAYVPGLDVHALAAKAGNEARALVATYVGEGGGLGHCTRSNTLPVPEELPELRGSLGTGASVRVRGRTDPALFAVFETHEKVVDARMEVLRRIGLPAGTGKRGADRNAPMRHGTNGDPTRLQEAPRQARSRRRVKKLYSGKAPFAAWLSTAPLEQWFGVHAVLTDLPSGGIDVMYAQVVEVKLVDNGLEGVVPPAFGSLQALTKLHLQQNRLGGGIPAELANAGALRELRLDHNEISGSLPPELGALRRLKLLDASHNGIVGLLPPQWAGCVSLEELRLHGNGIIGPLPAVWFNKVEGLDLSPAAVAQRADEAASAAAGAAEVALGAAVEAATAAEAALAVAQAVQAASANTGASFSEAAPAAGGQHEVPDKEPVATSVTAQMVAAIAEAERAVSTAESRGGFQADGLATVAAAVDGQWASHIHVNRGREVLVGLRRRAERARTSIAEHAEALTAMELAQAAVATHAAADAAAAAAAAAVAARRAQVEAAKATKAARHTARQLQCGALRPGPAAPAVLDHALSRGMEHLRVLDLGRNRLSGGVPPELGQLRRLRTLCLEHNRLGFSVAGSDSDEDEVDGSGPQRDVMQMWCGAGGEFGIPEELSQCAELQLLNLSANGFGGELPWSLCFYCSELDQLLVGGNRLTGAVPDSVGALKRLRVLSAGGNAFSGQLPLELLGCSELISLCLKPCGRSPAEMAAFEEKLEGRLGRRVEVEM